MAFQKPSLCLCRYFDAYREPFADSAPILSATEISTAEVIDATFASSIEVQVRQAVRSDTAPYGRGRPAHR